MRKWYILAPLIAITGGLFAILTSAAEEIKYIGYFGPFIAAPIVEEAIKPTGVYFLLAKKPASLRSPRYTAFLAALAGLSFGIIESIIYVTFPHKGVEIMNWQLFVIWRFTVCLVLHTGCSFLVGHGINQQLLASVKGDIPFLKGNWKYFIIPMSVHAVYNIGVTVLTWLNLMPI
jgi:RsiW-degrading membrane proteinase PrsW (M82 family)